MLKFYFTFGSGQPLAGKCLPVFAKDSGAARAYMFKFFGGQWGFQYSEAEWEQMKQDPWRMYRMEEELPSVYCGE